jgi:hypothetical protein
MLAINGMPDHIHFFVSSICVATGGAYNQMYEALIAS